MGFENSLPIQDVPGAIIAIVGALALAWLLRYWRVPYVFTVTAVLLLLISYFSIEENMIPTVRRMFPAEYRAKWIPTMITTVFFAAVATSVCVFLRRRVPVFHSERRKFLSHATAAVCAVPAVALTAGFITRKDFYIREIEVPIPGLPRDLEGLRLLQVSDFHTGPFFSVDDVGRVVDAANQLRPDLAFITGDLITDEYDPLDACLRQLARLKAASGVWGCLGNHEIFAHVEEYVQRQAALLGMTFLRQQAVKLRFGNQAINLVGVDYQRRNMPYLENIEPLVDLSSFNLLLSHNPDVFPVAAAKGFDLTLSGHTHGGQINFEILGRNLNITDFFTPYTKGLYTQPTSSIYVTSGLGTIGMPVRLGAPPEITLIRLCNS
ncbi:MAG TPA: metallophosphoesterase [Bryobacteraceae bacterium]|nr:metallophosphoesterase [Bryobacteraceae bacterium]